ncbi:hypothetical protein CLOM_g4662 [Closterium sp. NIES-68]|nr:hypothetical protein CLOM_g4662 [Closterium sp. NIES-68]GJP57692.1 hypothetical protein CLOP_g17108 [Closterium sp. NIES-67]
MAPATSKQVEHPTSSLAEIAVDCQRDCESPQNERRRNKAASQTSSDAGDGDGDGNGSSGSSPGPATWRSSDGNESSIITDLDLLARAKRLSLGAAALESRGDLSRNDMLISGTYGSHSRPRITPLIAHLSDAAISPSTSSGSLSHSAAGSPKKSMHTRRPGSAAAGSPKRMLQSRRGSADLLAHVETAARQAAAIEAAASKGEATNEAAAKYSRGRARNGPSLETKDDLAAAFWSRRREQRATDDFTNLVELVRLREANVRLEAEVTRLREKSDRLEGERRRLSARLAAVHTAMQQLEREASIRSRTRAEATMVTQHKGWNRWFSGDPSAMERVLETAEDARVERAAAAATVEKLVEENARLVQQVNEQKLLVTNLVTTLQTSIPRSSSGVPMLPHQSPLSSLHPLTAASLSHVLTQPLPAHATSAAGARAAAGAAAAEDRSPSSSSTHSHLSFPTSSLSTPAASSLGSKAQAAVAAGVAGSRMRVPVPQDSQDESSRSPSPLPAALHSSGPFPAAVDSALRAATDTSLAAASGSSRGGQLTAEGSSTVIRSAYSSSSSLATDATSLLPSYVQPSSLPPPSLQPSNLPPPSLQPSSLLPVVRDAPPPSGALCAQRPTPTLAESTSRYPAIWPVAHGNRDDLATPAAGRVAGEVDVVAVTVDNGTVGDGRAQVMVEESGCAVAAGGGAGAVAVAGRAGVAEQNVVSLIDSPLVGAPFRLAFFLVKVVSKTGIVQRLAGRLVGGRNKNSGGDGGSSGNGNADMEEKAVSPVGML